jgi:threonine dehydrogenase-like Zn-dependent dehydrogenase
LKGEDAQQAVELGAGEVVVVGPAQHRAPHALQPFAATGVDPARYL